MLLICRDNTVQVFWPLSGGRRNDARESIPCMTSLVSFHDLIRQVSPGVMKVDGLDIDVGVEGVLVVENRTSCIMGHVEPTSKNVMIDILGCLLQGNDMPPSCNLFFEGIFFSTSGPRGPVVDAESLLHNRSGRKMCWHGLCENTQQASFLMPRENLR